METNNPESGGWCYFRKKSEEEVMVTLFFKRLVGHHLLFFNLKSINLNYVGRHGGSHLQCQRSGS